MGKTKYKTKIARNAGEWSDERILATGKAYRSMSDERFWSRYENLRAIGDSIREEDARNATPPPYVIRRLIEKDAKGITDYLKRRGATFDLRKWCKENDIKL